MTLTKPKKVWASLITNLDYLPGLLTLSYSLSLTRTRYPFVALYTPSFPASGLEILAARGILSQLVQPVQASSTRVYEQDPRFVETWNKLGVFGLVEYERVVLLDGDMLVRRNMDELMDVELGEESGRVFAASHACACNPLKKEHYPATWIPQNCAFTTQHPDPSSAQKTGAPPSTGVGMLNSGLLVVHPSQSTFTEITTALTDSARISKYDFPDQELLSDVFKERWVPLPYVYNALKTLRWEGVHGAIWRDVEVKNVHYIFAKKPWHEPEAREDDEPNRWWWEVNGRRQREERGRGITDGY